MTSRRLLLRRPVPGSPAELARRFAGDPESWLPPPARRRGMGHWSVDLAAGPLHRRVACGVGSVWQVGAAMWRTVTWEPVAQKDEPVPAEQAVPALRGELGLTVADGETALVLDGVYRPPGGAVGVAADKALLHRVAESTGAAFLREVAERLHAVPAEHAHVRGSEPRESARN